MLLRPGEMKILRITGPSVAKLIRDGVFSAGATRVHLQVDFDSIDSAGRIYEKIMGVTEYKIQNGEVVQVKMRQDDQDEFVDLLK